MTTYSQRELRELLPGAPGGFALRNKYGMGYLREIAANGGNTTLQRYGKTHMALIGERGRAARRTKAFTQPRTVTIRSSFLIEIWRIVPYWPPRSRRKRPLLVIFYLLALDSQTGAVIEEDPGVQ